MKTPNSSDFKNLVWISFTDFMLATTAVFILLFLLNNPANKDKEIKELKNQIAAKSQEYKNKDKENRELKEKNRTYEDTEKVKTDFMKELLLDSNGLIATKNNKYYIKHDDLLFDNGQYTLADKGKIGLKKISKDISSKITKYKSKLRKIDEDLNIYLQVSGHTDSKPMYSDIIKDNWDLSVKRATEVVRFLSENSVPSKNLMAVGFSEFKPLNKNTDANNRRVELEIHIE